MTKTAPAAGKKRLNLGLQGGGSHGAFTWGVLDRLLEVDELELVGISGTSAGAMNAAALAYGLAVGGKAGARACLAEFWGRIAAAARLSPLQPSPLDRWLGLGNMDFSPGWIASDNLARLASPYELNPLNFHPLKDVLEAVVDFQALRRSCAAEQVLLFLCATNVGTGRIKIFEGEEIGLDAVLASACLPWLFQAVEIDGQHYWDGGYSGNPPIYPLIYGTDCEDVLIVQINPINIESVPRTASEIVDRVNELSFNSTLMREMARHPFRLKLLDEHRVERGHKRLNIHTVEAETELARLGSSSKVNADKDFLGWLFDLGRERCARFLDAHYEKIGVESSTDVGAKFL
ncbi:MAG: patatin-like phospholipase family protein [Geminicoccaceae bacterium]